MTMLLNRIGLVVSMEYTSASYLSGWRWWEACRNLLLVALLGPVELLGLRLVSCLLPSQPHFIQRWGDLPAHCRALSVSFPDPPSWLPACCCAPGEVRCPSDQVLEELANEILGVGGFQ